MPSRKLPELLAPAGSPDALKAAAAAGADAIYISGKRFGARRFAPNFSEKELEEAIGYAHIRGIKVYVTVNTLIREDELEDAALYLLKLYEMGADAVLVQDAGLAGLARQVTPELDLHASTQMTIHNSPGVAWAVKLGMKRVVLAREISLEEIEKMASEAEIGQEVFIHGALCYCYSGQCLLSSAIGGRSGNRGMCAQPCRKPYILQRGDRDEYGLPVNLSAASVKDRFLLSTRDLSVYGRLDRIVKSKIQSLKVEGRMKSPEYVAIVTSIYRDALDKIAKGDWSPSEKDMGDLALAFNRDFTEGHLLRSKEIMGRDMSDNRGVFIGTVASYDSRRGEASIRPTGLFMPDRGDGLVLLAPGQEIGLVAYKPYIMDGMLRLGTPERAPPGTKVYLTSSAALSRRAREIISRTLPQIPIDLRIDLESSVPAVCIEGLKGWGVDAIEQKPDFRMEPALNKPLTAEQIETQIRKTGGTSFFIRKLDMKYPGGLFAPISALNKLRRDILAKAETALLSAWKPPLGSVKAARKRLEDMDVNPNLNLNASTMPPGRAPSLAAYADSLDTIVGSVEGGCRRIYFEPHIGRRCGQKGYAEDIISILKEARDLCVCEGAQLIWKLPRITRDEYLKIARPLLPRSGADGIMVEGLGAADFVLSAVPQMPISGSMGLNVWNHLTVMQLSQFRRLTLSPELSSNQLSSLVDRAHLRSSPDLELVVQGNLEVMVTEDCLPSLSPGKAEFLGLQDFKRVFPLYADDEARTHILNSVETCLIDHMPDIFEIGLDGIAIDARRRTKRYAKEMAQLYVNAIELTEKGGAGLEKDLESLKEEARQRSLGGITTGHFLKGLKD
jgi:putative protease